MALIAVKNHANEDDIIAAMEDFGEFIKIVVDIEKKEMIIGGKWHDDAVTLLIQKGSKRENLWGGSVDIGKGAIDTLAVINIRQGENDSHEILDPHKRTEFVRLVKEKLLI